MDCGIIDGKFAVAYALGADGDYNTKDDREIYIHKDGDAASTKLNANPSVVSNPQFGKMNGQNLLYWYNDANINYIASVDGAVNNVFNSQQGNLTDNFSIISDSQNSYIVWSIGSSDENEEDVTDVFVTKYDVNKWTESVKVAELGANASKLSGIINLSNNPEIVFADREILNDIYRIRQLEIAPEPDIALFEVNYNKELVGRNTLLPLDLLVLNKGRETITQVNVEIVNNYSTVYTGTVTALIPPGETKEVQVTNFTLPNFTSVSEYTIRAYLQNEQDLSDNDIEALIGYADLELTVDKYLSADDWYTSVTIENKTGVPTNSIFRIFADEEDGAILFEERTGVIEKGTNLVMTFALAELTKDTYVDTMIFSVIADEEEFYMLNNSEMVVYAVNTTSAQEFQLTIVAGSNGTADSSVNGQYQEGDVINLSATADLGYRFKNWTSSDGGTFVNVNSEATTFTMPANDTIVTAHFEYIGGRSDGSGGGGGGAPSANNSTLSTNNVIFDSTVLQDVTVTLTLNGNTLSSIRRGNTTLTEGTHYTVSGNTVTIKAEYLATLEAGEHTITFQMSGGTSPNLIITVTDTTPLQETAPKYTVMKPTKIAGAQVVALKTRNSLILNDEEKDFPAVNIDDYNWLKLRDVAMLLTKTSKQFSLNYDPATRIVDISTGSEYRALGDELKDELQEPVTAIATTQKLRMNGEFIDVAAYNIKGYNYLRLRDLAILLDFAVDYDDNDGKISLDLAKPYWE